MDSRVQEIINLYGLILEVLILNKLSKRIGLRKEYIHTLIRPQSDPFSELYIGAK